MSNLIASIYESVILKHPRIILALLALLLIGFGTQIIHFKLDASSDSLLLENDEDFRRYTNVIKRYGVREFLFVTVTPKGDLFAPDTIELVGQLRDEIDALESVSSVNSMLDVPLVKNVEGSLTQIAKNFRLLESDDVDVEKARKELTTSPIYSDLVVNTAGTTTALQIFLADKQDYAELQRRRNDLRYKRSTEVWTEAEAVELARIEQQYQQTKTAIENQNHQAVADIRTIMAKYEDRAKLHLGGLPMIVDDMISYIGNDLIVFGIGVFVFLVLMLSLIFREARWVILPLASCSFAAFLMLGLLGLINWKVTVISSNFVSLMLIITMSMNIHLIVRYRELFRDLPDASQYELVKQTMAHMVRPCLYTALTTIIAFASLVFSGIKPVIDFGWMMTIGLTVVFLTSFTLFPALLLQFAKKPLRVPEGDHYRFTEVLGRVTERFGTPVLIVSAILAILGCIGVTKLEVENSFIDYFHEDTEIYQGLKQIDETLGGTTPVEIILKFDDPDSEEESDDDSSFDADLDALFGAINEDEEQEDIWFSPEKIDRIKAVHDYLESLPEIGKVLSLASTIRIAESLNEGREFDAFQMNVIYKRIPFPVRVAVIDPYLSIHENEARISVRIYDSTPNLRRNELLKKINRDLKNELGLTEAQYEVSGLLVLYNNMLQSLFKSQIQTLGVVMVGIMLMLWVLFRSVKVALIGIIPNILAATTILGVMGWMRVPLDMMTITIAAITIGIAVDDCIHYIYRFKVEHPERKDYLSTMHYCHANIAKAAFYTTITITVGFSILVLSNFIPTILFGVLTAIAMVIALLAALTLMAKLIITWRPFSA
ncbi:MAG: MMPL family transporter [Pseudomonadota bacterium]